MKRFEQIITLNYKKGKVESAVETKEPITMVKSRVKKDYKKKLHIPMIYKRNGDTFVINTCTKRRMTEEKIRLVCRYVLVNHIGE